MSDKVEICQEVLEAYGNRDAGVGYAHRDAMSLLSRVFVFIDKENKGRVRKETGRIRPICEGYLRRLADYRRREELGKISQPKEWRELEEDDIRYMFNKAVEGVVKLDKLEDPKLVQKISNYVSSLKGYSIDQTESFGDPKVTDQLFEEHLTL